MKNQDNPGKKYKKAYVEITNACNLACPFCAPKTRPTTFMSRARFEHLLCEIGPLCEHLYLHVLGEPTLHPEFLSFVRYAAEKGFKVNLTTNGTLPAIVISALPYLRKAALSVHSAYFNAVDREAYFEGIRQIVESRGKTIVELRLFDDKEMLADVFRRLTLAPAVFKAGGARLSENLYLSVFERFEWEKKGLRERGCLGLIDQFGVLADGRAVPCCIDYAGEISLGSAFDDGLESCLFGERARAIEAGFRKGEIVDPVCAKCTFRRK